jgi:alginate O-acetyltransferase complex protein AlgI
VVFSSHIFIFYFLPLTLLLYYAAPWRGRHLVLTLLSYLFYGWANPLFVVLLLFSTVVDYLCGLAIVGSAPLWLGRLAKLRLTQTGVGFSSPDSARRTPDRWRRELVSLEPDTSRTRGQRIAVAVSVCVNLALLGFFKYFNFGVESYDALLPLLGLDGLRLELAFRITLPLGISFYTFQSMSYTIDIYRGHATPLRSFIDFACYVSMFPQLVAGPIIRFSEVADQLRHRSCTATKFARGVAFLSVGLAKKILLANPCGQVADLTFDAGSLGALDAWYGLVAYAFQIYFDFSAYSDMAIGLGLMLGFVFPKNFDSPYRSASITEFWRRWHISLSSWLRDYLYVPLGGSRRGSRRTYINLLLVMVLGGLWHGAAWTFVIWGGLHGTALALERTRGKTAHYDRLPRPIRVGVTFILVSIGWVFFRAADLGEAMRYLQTMLGLGAVEPSRAVLAGVLYQPYLAGAVTVAALVTWSCPQTWDWSRQLTAPRAGLTLAALGVALAVLSTQAYNPFIYFIF